MTSSAADTRELMIVKEPKEDDVLLGQGHYRHPGNQMLNQIVDSKVDEYKNQSRPFKTYMAHEIIHSLRSKGVRFLKELAGRRGWIIAKDDKEAREKVAQRFQYMMRKQAENPAVAPQEVPAAAKQAASFSSTAVSLSSAELLPSLQHNLIWNGTTVKVPFLPVFHQLQKSSVMVDDDVNEVSKRLLDCFRIVGVRENFNHEQANALLSLPESLKIQMNLWKPLGGNCGVIVELVNLEGNHEVFKKYSRHILEAATGLFQQYGPTLFQPLRLASVQDHAKAFTSAWASADKKKLVKIGAEERKPVIIEALTDRNLQAKKDNNNGLKGSNSAKRTFSFKTLPVKRLDQSKMPPLAQKEGTKKLAPMINAEMDSMTGCFASAFSRWETGIGASDPAAAFDSSKLVEARKYPLPARKNNRSSCSDSSENIENVWEPYPIHAGIALPVDGNMALAPTDMTCDVAVSYEPCVVPTTRYGACEQVSAETAHLESFGMGSDKCFDGRLARPKATTPTTAKRKAVYMLPLTRATPTTAAKDSSVNKFGGCNALAGPTVNTAKHGRDETVDPKQPYPFVGWARVLTNQETTMRCDSIADERIDAEMISIVHTTESIKRLSLSSFDGSCIEPQTTRDFIEAFPVGVWPVATEMGCDNSWDDGSKQSFIPSAFFGPAYPQASATLRVNNAPSPAHSFGSQISVEMLSVPSPSPSPSITSNSVDAFSLPSPACSFNSKCSLGMNSLKHGRMDASISPSMFQSDQSSAAADESLMLGADPSYDSVPPTIYIDSSAHLAP